MKLSIGLVAFAFSLLAFLVKLEARANPASSAVNSNSQLVSVQPSHPSAPKPQASLISSSEILLNNQSLNINFSDF
ncbi:MAG: hypothetical protein KDD35_01100 [Bdellovibrionales bacterium]|nr:hypothetical protein [Bdellovibrionales bacterium]